MRIAPDIKAGGPVQTSPLSTTLPPAILLMGPTASGKSALALELCKQLPVEIISVDSAQIYRRMNIGTAKPDSATQIEFPHHLIDIIDPTESYSVAQFRNDAIAIMDDITRRGRIPLLVGGTMLYFKALREGLSELPAADDATRMRIDSMARETGWPALHEELRRIDPKAAARINVNDPQRIQRALEICYLSGNTMSELLDKRKHAALPFQLTNISLVPSDRAWLHKRIERRFDQMLEQGLISELRSLREAFTLSPGLPSMRCVGYRQVWQHLDGQYNAAALREKSIAATRQFAKRQLTWLRGMNNLVEFDCLRDDLPTRIGELLRKQLAVRD